MTSPCCNASPEPRVQSNSGRPRMNGGDLIERLREPRLDSRALHVSPDGYKTFLQLHTERLEAADFIEAQQRRIEALEGMLEDMGRAQDWPL